MTAAFAAILLPLWSLLCAETAVRSAGAGGPATLEELSEAAWEDFGLKTGLWAPGEGKKAPAEGLRTLEQAPPAPSLPAPRPVSFNGVTLPSFQFAPYHSTADSILKAVRHTKRFALVALYDLDNVEIAEALLKARRNGVNLYLVLDEKNLFPKDDQGNPAPVHPAVQKLIDAKADIHILRGLSGNGSMHNKFAVLDGLLLTGSYNWTETSEKQHYENAAFTNDPWQVRGFHQYFAWMWRNSKTVDQALKDGPGGAYPPAEPPFPRTDPAPQILFHEKKFPTYVFSPEGNADTYIMRAIRFSTQTVDVAMFSFYSFSIAGTLKYTKERGVAVRVLLDKGQALEGPVLDYFVKEGVEVRLLAGPNGEGPHERMHNKFAIFDGEMLQTGSYNYSPNAEKRSMENVTFTKDPIDVAGYKAYFEVLWNLAKPPPHPTLPPTGGVKEREENK